MKHKFLALSFCVVAGLSAVAADKGTVKYKRAVPPTFQDGKIKDIFYADVGSQLVGTLPTLGNQSTSGNSQLAGNSDQAEEADAEGQSVWKRRIDVATIEDMVKSSKLRLDPAVSSPAKFASGGYEIARREFTLLTAMFGVIDQYPGDVRWKHSAKTAETDFARIAANSKVGSIQAFNEAKAKTLEFSDLLNGVRLDAAKEPVEGWPNAIDRGSLMEVLQWTLRDNLNETVTSDSVFSDKTADAKKFAQLTAVLGEVLLQPDMMDADDDGYKQWAVEMISASEAVVAATQTANLSDAREAISRIDKSCNSCHEGFR